jgi:hypothetical protein
VSYLIFEVGMAGPRLTRDGMDSRQKEKFVIQEAAAGVRSII